MNRREKCFIILSPGFAASENDSTCLPMQQQFVKTLSELYPHLSVVVLAFQYPYHEKTYCWHNITVQSFNGRNKGGIPKLFLRQKTETALKKISKEKQIIGLLSFWLNECALVGKRFGAKNNIPHYCWLLGQDAKKENKYPQRLSVASNELIALSDFLQDEFDNNHGVRPFAVIPPGIEAKQRDERKRDIDLLTSGSLIPLKRLELFIKLVAQIKQSYSDVKAVLAGDGPKRKYLEVLTIKYRMENNIFFTGEISHQEVLQLMQRTKVFIHPSSYEGFSGVCQEALSEGVHVISFCRAMKNDIDHWHIVNGKNELKQKAMELLSQSLDHHGVSPYLMTDTVQRMMRLYGEGQTAFFSEFNNEMAFSKTKSGV